MKNKEILTSANILLIMLIIFSIHNVFAVSPSMHNNFSAEKIVTENFTGNTSSLNIKSRTFSTGTNLQVGFIFTNNFNSSAVVSIKDNNDIAGSGFVVPCYQVVVPPNRSLMIYSHKVFLSSPGSFVVQNATLNISVKNETFSYETNSVPITVTGKDLGINAVTRIYRCNGQSYSSTSYSSSSSSSGIVINNGNVEYAGSIGGEAQNDFDKMNKYINKINQQMNQMFNSMFPQNIQPNQNYNPFAGNVPSSNSKKENKTSNSNFTSQPVSRSFNSPVGASGKKSNIVPPKTKKLSYTPSKMVFEDHSVSKSLISDLLKGSLLFIIILLILSFVLISKLSKKKQIENIVVSEDRDWVSYFKEIKKKASEIHRLRKSKKEYLLFKNLVDEFKKLIEEDELFDSEIIEELNLFLYKDDVKSLENAITKINHDFA